MIIIGTPAAARGIASATGGRCQVALLNYTTTVDVHKTIGEISGLLIAAKAQAITTLYDDGVPMTLAFKINTAFGERAFQLPVNVEAIHRVMLRQSANGKIPRRLVTRDQAARVGWRIIKDWLAAQLAIIETEMVALEQVMLPYMMVERNKSLFQAYQEDQGVLLLETRSQS